MSNEISITSKNDELMVIKKKINLVLIALITALGVSSLFIKFFLIDGVIAFRAFTVDGNLFTTIVYIVALIKGIKGFKDDEELSSRKMFFLMLASAVTEAVIFIVVMIGYLPVFPDDPKITPYNMFCLHVAIPILSVFRFIFFEKPQGILRPSKLLIGAIPIGVYGFGVVNAIKLGILPISLVPYSFLNFDSNFLWYFLFALLIIPSFGFLWSWMFYRLNLRASLLWYSRDDLEKLGKERVKALSNFDVINSSILLIYFVIALAVLMFSLMGISKTSTTIQYDLMSDLCYVMFDDYSNMLGSDDWNITDGALYKGDVFVGDGIESHANEEILGDDVIVYDTAIYVQAKDLTKKVSSNYDAIDYVCVKHSSGKISPIASCGEVLDNAVVAEIITDEYHMYSDEVKIDGNKYYRCFMAFGHTLMETGVGIIEIVVPTDDLVKSAKNAEYNHDIMMIVIIIAAFALLYIVTYLWIRTLEKSVNYLKAIASGRTPEEPIILGKTNRLSGLARELNILREINK